MTIGMQGGKVLALYRLATDWVGTGGVLFVLKIWSRSNYHHNSICYAITFLGAIQLVFLT
jgi:hypothetical protein